MIIVLSKYNFKKGKNMLKSQEIFEVLNQNQINFITGVPCSIFKDFLVYLNKHPEQIKHVRAASEGEAVGIAAGHYLATSKLAVVYMQNAGLGNCVNPLTSLMDEKVYSIPSLMFVSWRGEPGKPDEPQHAKMGLITDKLLETLGVPYEIAKEDISEFSEQIRIMQEKAFSENRTVALIFKKGIIEKEDGLKSEQEGLLREQALDVLLKKIGSQPIISTTGKTSREIFELREKNKQSHDQDFLTVGSMGCTAGIGLGLALNSHKNVFVIDGDGAVLMKMGTLATIGESKPKNFVHIVIDNNSYESTGGQPTTSNIINWQGLFKSAGYQSVIIINSQEELEKLDFSELEKPGAVIIKSRTGSRSDLGRPTQTPVETKNNFMKFLKS